MSHHLALRSTLPLRAYNAGLQVSRGTGQHEDRRLWFFDLLFVRQGVLPIQEEEQAFQVVAGQTLLLWPHRHHWGTGKFSPDMRLYWLHFDVLESSVEEDDKDDALPFPLSPSTEPQRDRLEIPQYATVARPDVLESLFRRFLDDQATGRLSPHYANLLTGLILCEIADQRETGTGNRQQAVLAGRALAYIRAHLHQPLTASLIAGQLGYQGDYLNRVFHHVYGHTLTQEIHLSRIGYARYLLLHSSQSVKEVALSCGFHDVNYFVRLFKRYEGTTAANFRRLHAQAEVNYES